MIEHKYFDWNNIIVDSDKQSMINDVKTAIDAGNFIESQPKYQANFTVFDRPELYWQQLKYSFIMSAYGFLNKTVPIVGIRSWSFMTSLSHVEDRETLWHHHHHDKEHKTLSGVFYLQVPILDDDCGTEFAPNGPEQKERVMLPPRLGQWVIYNGQEWHRPGVVKSMDYRFIVAADMIYMDNVI